MDSAQEGKKECCDSKGSCGCGSGRKCCCGKALLVVLLFLVGGVIGYLMGSHCAMKGRCTMGMMMNHDAMTAPQK